MRMQSLQKTVLGIAFNLSILSGCASIGPSTQDIKMPPAQLDKKSIKRLVNCKVENRKRICIV